MPTSRSRRLLTWCVVAVTTTLIVGSGAAAIATSPPPSPARVVTITIPAPGGQIPAQWLSYPGPPRANVLLPAGYDAHKRYPLLLLLNGLANNYDSYLEDGIVAKLEASGLNAIVVMPEGGSGWYADWWNGGQRGSPSWETYELDDVLPTVLARYPILPERRYHAVAGFSMGGLGAVYLAGRLPGFFGSVASLSGFDDPQYYAPITSLGMGLVSFAPLKGDHNFDPVYGPPDGFYADGHNPTRLAVNLQATRVFESTGTGVPSRAGLASVSGGAPSAAAVVTGAALEAPIIYPMNQLYHAALRAAHVNVTYQVHPGGHDLPDFDLEFDALLAWGLFRPVTEGPAAWTNSTVATSGQLWEIAYRFDRPPNQVVQFRQSGDTLSISAAGTPVTVTIGIGCTLHAATPVTVLLPSGCT